MLIVRIVKAKKLKQAVKTMASIAPRCWMQWDQEMLELGVRDEANDVPMVLFLHRAGFISFTLNGHHLTDSIVEFDLQKFDRILNLYKSNEAFRLQLDDHASEILFFRNNRELMPTLAVSQIQAPHFRIQDYCTASPLRTFTMSPHIVSVYLEHSSTHRTRIAFRLCPTWVLAISTEMVGVHPNENYSLTEHDNNSFRVEFSLRATQYIASVAALSETILFHLSKDPVFWVEFNKFPVEFFIRAADYLASAAAISETILLHLSIDPTLYPDIVPSISFNLDAKTVLTFILPFDSIMGPWVF